MKERKERAEAVKPTAAETAEAQETEVRTVFHDKTAEETLGLLSATEHGLAEAEAERRLGVYGANALAEGKKK